MKDEGRDDEGQGRQPQPPPPAAVSHCLHGGKRVLMDDNDAETTRRRQTKRENGPRDVDDVSWATGIYFLFPTFLFTNQVF